MLEIRSHAQTLSDSSTGRNAPVLVYTRVVLVHIIHTILVNGKLEFASANRFRFEINTRTHSQATRRPRFDQLLTNSSRETISDEITC